MIGQPKRIISHEPERISAVIAAVGAAGGLEAGPVVVRKADWPSLRPWLGFHRLSGLAMYAVSEGRLRLPPSAIRDLVGMHHDAMSWSLTVERAAVQICAALDESGIDAVILKGSAFAHRFYDDPGWRPFSDLDLLVRTADLVRAGAVLEKHGVARTLPEPRPGFDARFGTGAVHRRADGLEVDLHRTLVKGPFGLWMRPEELFDATAQFSLGGLSVRRLDDTASLLHACIHGALGALPPLFMPLRDVAQIAWRGDTDWDRFQAWAHRWRLGAVVAYAFETVSDLLGIAMPPQVRALASNGTGRKERRALRAYTTDRQRRGGRTISTMSAIPGLRGKAAYALALAVPSRGFLAARQGEADASYARRWAVALRWLRKP